MRVDRIDLYSNDNEVARFDVNVLDIRNPYVIKAITGLDGDQIVPRFYGNGLVSGTAFYDMALEPREVAMRIGLNPNYNVNASPSDLRSDLYRAVASSRGGTVKLKFNDDNSVVGVLTGVVTKFEAPIFSDTPEVQITIRCEDPIIKSDYLTSVIVADLDEAAPLLTDPVSTSPHGFKFKLTFTGSVNPFVIRDTSTPEWKFQVDYAFLSGDELYFSSETDDKYLYRVRSAVSIQLMDMIQPGSVWPIIFPGENQFDVVGTSFVWNECFWFETHWGV